MDANEKLRRALSDEWEFVGDPHSLCRLLRAEVLRLRATLQRIALLADTGSEAHKEEFATYYANYDKPSGWRIVERMRDIANDVVGSLPLPEDLTIYKRACDSMAAQFVHPKMTGLELAQMQLKGTTSAKQ